ncbi:MAG: Preprotein translocase subunit SecA, partial [Candidatus Hydrogenedentes bacterium]|nr:Preprotein translocase subunit SecA [Candidatus Hydrogenedentota bacterium]
KKMLDWFGNEEMDDEPLSQRMVSRTIERAQKQVEEYNFEIRKHLKEYDDVMNKQRQIIYTMRRDVLEDRDISEQLREMFQGLVDDCCDKYAADDVLPEEWDLEGLDTSFRRIFGFAPDLAGPEDREPDELHETLGRQVLDEYVRREEAISEEIRKAYREQIGGDEKAVDFAKLARKRVHDYEMMALLRAVDDKWIDHLYSMDYLRDSVRLRAYGQRDPLLEYKTEGFEMFQEMLKTIEENVAQTLFRLTDPEVRRTRQTMARHGALTMQNDPFAQLSRYTYVSADKQQDRSFAAFDTSRFALAGQPSGAQSGQGGSGDDAERPRVKLKPMRAAVKVGPNDKCPCGSGKKYKKCCGAQQIEDES